MDDESLIKSLREIGEKIERIENKLDDVLNRITGKLDEIRNEITNKV